MGDGSLRLLLVDTDPIFRLGLKTGVDELPGATLISTGDRPGALTILANQGQTSDLPISVVLIDAITDGLDPNNLLYAPWSLCEEIHQTYPRIPILVLGNGLSEIALIRAQRAGASGYCTKNSSASRLVAIARQAHRGETIWPALPSLTPKDDASPVSASQEPSLKFKWNNQGLREIDRAMAQLNTMLARDNLAQPKNLGDRLQKLIIEGRRRELRAARRVVITVGGGFTHKPGAKVSGAQKRKSESSLGSPDPALRPTNQVVSSAPGQPQKANSSVNGSSLNLSSSSSATPESNPSSSVEIEPNLDRLTIEDIAESNLVQLQSALLDRCTSKLINAQNNQTGAPLEIDILKPEQRKDLLYLVLRKVDDLLIQLRRQKRSQQTNILSISVSEDDHRRLWEESLEDFFKSYKVCQINGQSIEIFPILKSDWDVLRQDILSRAVELDNLINHIVFGEKIIADNGTYPPGNAIALERAEALLQNWVLCLANAVVQPLINRLSDIESLKYEFFDRRWMATRYVEKFRNDLSWKYRLARYVETPAAIFESRYWLLVSDGRSIEKIPVYAPRNEELRSLSGIPLGVTLLLEARDAVAPRLRSAVSFLGQGTLIVLQAVGRGIGLVGRGILQGIGASWQDFRKGNKSEDA
ncbi:MAG: DUF3685 domain-containing protein [Cyanophyceae cyanobacterium]